ncbi:hypothetical protein BT63DRAFT_446268 [Microthyrium microscopicum]|uniref:60S ribosomal protein L27 n=1 Tax=Microthyrium microscopicum TaxID=703497 RepID=A0A6A6UHX2_9PEZI|nr:hypothetical protein BT63DRAFT_446268 [Microthyrium microscopicum]
MDCIGWQWKERADWHAIRWRRGGLSHSYGQPHDSCKLTLPLQVVLIQPNDQGAKGHNFPHAIVAGIQRYPQKITKRMGAKKVQKRSKVKPFVKVVNYNHLMPTRYTLELEGLKGIVGADTLKEPEQRKEARKNVKKVLEERFSAGKNRWFFTPLRF